jgi:hypothetical protein
MKSLLSATLVLCIPGFAASPKPVNASIDPMNRSHIYVLFDNPAPAAAAVDQPGYWLVYETTKIGSGRVNVDHVDISDLGTKQVGLYLVRKIAAPPDIKSVAITLANQNDIVAVPKIDSTSGIQPGPEVVESTSKTDSDIYFNGSYTAVIGGDPVYDIDAFAGYMRAIPGTDGTYGRVGLYGQVRTKMSTVADPNSFLNYLVYQKVIGHSTDYVQAPIFNYRFFGAEFDRTARELNLLTSPTLTIPIRPVKPMSNLSGKIDPWPMFNLTLGAEFVNVRKSVLAPVGDWHTRGLVGMNFAIGHTPRKNGFYSLKLTSSWQMRLPAAAEIFYDDKFAPIDPSTGKKNVKKTPAMLGTQPRHFVDTKVSYNLTSWGGVTFEHSYGSLPPIFFKTDQTFAVGLSLTLKQGGYGRYSILKP